jgi:hypothetical protein
LDDEKEKKKRREGEGRKGRGLERMAIGELQRIYTVDSVELVDAMEWMFSYSACGPAVIHDTLTPRHTLMWTSWKMWKFHRCR